MPESVLGRHNRAASKRRGLRAAQGLQSPTAESPPCGRSPRDRPRARRIRAVAALVPSWRCPWPHPDTAVGDQPGTAQRTSPSRSRLASADRPKSPRPQRAVFRDLALPCSAPWLSSVVILGAIGTRANGAARSIGFAANPASNVKRGKPGKEGNELHSLSPGVYNPALELMTHQGGKTRGQIDGTERKHRPDPPRLAL